MDGDEYEPVTAHRFDVFGFALIAVEFAEDVALATASAFCSTKALLGAAYKWRLERQLYIDSMESLPTIITD